MKEEAPEGPSQNGVIGAQPSLGKRGQLRFLYCAVAFTPSGRMGKDCNAALPGEGKCRPTDDR